MSRLCVAVEAGNFQEVKRLVESGIDLSCCVWLGKRPLHYAVAKGQLEIVKYLVEHGANVNCKSRLNCTPLYDAVQIGSLEIVKYLVENGAEVTSEHHNRADTVLYSACEQGNELIVQILLENGAVRNINRCDYEQRSPLSIACYKGHTAVVKTLLHFNVDLRKEQFLVCGNDEIMEIINVHQATKSVKHLEKIKKLKAVDEEKLMKISPHVKYFVADMNFLLGKGSMGTTVYCGIMDDGSEVAIKRTYFQPEYEDVAENEKNIFSRLDGRNRSPFIVNYRHFHRDDLFKYLIIDLCEETLKEHVKEHQSAEYLQHHGPRFIKEILSGLDFLHDSGILHGDLKPSNILVDVEGHMRLADFGFSRILNENESTVCTDPKGTMGWMPFEAIMAMNDSDNDRKQFRFKKKSDVQVAGMIAFFILAKGEHPFGPAINRMVNIVNGKPVALKKLGDRNARKFVSLMINQKIENRPYAFQALRHPFIFRNECFDQPPGKRLISKLKSGIISNETP